MPVQRYETRWLGRASYENDRPSKSRTSLAGDRSCYFIQASVLVDKSHVNLPASSLPPLSEITSDAETEENLNPNSGESLSDHSQSAQNNSTRLLSCFRRGFLSILASVIKGLPLPRGCFLPDFSPAPG